MKHKSLHYFKYGLITIGWMMVIWLLSNQSSLNVGFEGWIDVVIKQLAHVAVYAVLGLLLVKTVLGHKHVLDNLAPWQRYILIVITLGVGILYAFSDELHQYFVPGRDSSLVDIGFDVLGLIFGIVWGMRLQHQRLRYSLKVLLTK